MASLTNLPTGWVVWHEAEGGRVVLAYRPDVFDATAFPPGWLPTITVAPGPSPDARPQRRSATVGGPWHVALYFEPDVRLRSVEEAVDDRETAVDRAVAIAEQFVAGELDVREAYHEPPEVYLARLDELLGSSDDSPASGGV